MCDANGLPYKGEICAISNAYSDSGLSELAILDFLCGGEVDSTGTTQNLADDICNAWTEACVNGVPTVSSMCSTPYSDVPTDSLPSDFYLGDLCYRMSSAYEPEYPELVSSGVCDIDSDYAQYLCNEAGPHKGELCALWDQITAGGIDLEQITGVTKDELCGIYDADTGTWDESESPVA